MVGAVSFQPYVSSYQYTGYPRMRTSMSGSGDQAGHVSAPSSAAGAQTESAEKSGRAEPSVGARSLTAAGHTAVAAGRAADLETPVEPVGAASKIESGTAGRTDYGIPFLRAGMDPAELAVRMRIEYVGMPQSGKEGGLEAAELNLPGTKSEEAQAQVGISGTAADAVQPGSPGTKSEKDVELNLPGTRSEESVEPDLPGTSTDKVAEAGLPGASTEEEQAGVTGTDPEKDTPKIAGMGTGVEDTQKTAADAECKTCKERKYQDGSDDPGVSFKTPSHIDPGQASSAVRGHELEHVVRERARAEKEGRRVISQSVTMQTGICPECGRIYTAGGMTRTVTAADTKPKEAPKDPKWILDSAA